MCGGRKENKMSVNSEQRQKSTTQFLDTAAELAEFSLRKCKKFPTRWGREITDSIRADALGIMSNTKQGNSVFVKTAGDAALRRRFMMTAHAQLQSLVSTIGLAEKLFPLCGYLNRDEDGKKKKELTQEEKEKLEAEEKRRSRKIMEQWTALIYKENNLLKEVIRSDWERFKDMK